MATLYSGVHLRLRSKSTPWEEKLKLARFAWVSPRCFIPNKEQALLDWVTHTLSAVYSNKLKMKFHTVESLWAFLNDVLRSRKLQNLLKQKQTISLRVFFPQVYLATLLSCCSSVLSSSPLATIFSTKFELLMQLLQSLLQIACASVHSPPAATTVAVVFPVLLRTLTLYEMTQRQQCNSWRVFRELTGQILEPSLELRQWLLRAPSVHSEAHKVRMKVEAAIQAGLFDRSLLPTYRDELLSQVQDKSFTVKTRNVTAKAQQPSLVKYLNMLMIILKAFSLKYSAISSSAHLVFSCFLEAFGTDENHLLCFCALRQLLPVIRFDCAFVERSAMPVDLTGVLIALDRLLSTALAADIYNIAVDHLEHGSIQFSCYRRLTDTLLRDPQPEQRAWYSSLHTLLLLNHQLLDADLRSVAAKVWAVELPLEKQARKARDELLAELTRVYSKLRQLPSLFSALVSVMYDSMVPTPRAVLAIAHARALANCLVELPPSQSLDIWEAVVVAGRNVLRNVKDEVQAEADMQMLRALGLLLHDVLSRASVLGGGDVPSMTEARVHSLMADTLDGVLLPLVDQLTVTNVKPNDSGLEAVLLFALVWTMISTFRDIQAFNNAQGHTFSAVSPVGSGGPATDFSCLLPRLEAKDWIRLCKPLKKCLGTPLALHLLTRLMLQKIRSLLLRQSNTDVTAPMAAHELVSSAKLFVKLCIGNVAVDGLIGAWDGMLCSVDGESYVTAQFYLLVSHLPMVTSILRPDSTRALASFLFDSFLVNVKPSSVKDVFTLHSLSQDLLLSGLIPELRYLQASLVTVLIERLANLFEEGEEGGPCFQKVPPGISSLHSWKVIRESANLILESAISCMPCSLPRDSAKELLSFLGVLSSLDLDAMLPGNKVRVFLVLFALVTKIGLMEEVTESDENLDTKLFVEEEEKITVDEEMVEEHEESKKEDQTDNATNGLIKDFVHVEQTKRLHDDCVSSNEPTLIRNDAESGHKSEVSGGSIILVEILSALCHVLLPCLWIEAQRATMMLHNLLCELMMKLNPKIFLELSIGAVTELLQMESVCVSLGRPRLCAAEKGSEDGGSEMVYDYLYEQVCKLVFHHPESYSDYNHQLKALLNFLKLFLGIKTLKQGSSSRNTGPCDNLCFWPVVMQIVMQHVSSMPSGQQTMVLAVLETLAVLLRAIVGSLRNPHHVAQALQALHAVPLQKLATREDHDVFHAYHEILHCILQLHPRVKLSTNTFNLPYLPHTCSTKLGTLILKCRGKEIVIFNFKKHLVFA
uniref:Uncharacterized protein n=1 Tax=Eptatretus burgeri TaxID=7764 RepID=A0A8C4WVW2_EPTBU